MNEIVLKGTIRNIKPSHTVNNIEYLQAEIITQRTDGKEDSNIIKFKKHINKYRELDYAELVGSIRSYTQPLQNGKNKVSIYVFTYQDIPNQTQREETYNNHFVVDGRICKIEDIRKTSNGKQNLHFTVANNIFTPNGQKINNYLPVTCWGKLADKVSKMQVNDQVIMSGELHSRTYNATLENGEKEFRVAHELLLTNIEVTN